METLHNGAQVLLRGENTRGDGFVLAIADRDFVTWTIDSDGNCFWGHYYSLTLDGLQDAIRDYWCRTEYSKRAMGTPTGSGEPG